MPLILFFHHHAKAILFTIAILVASGAALVTTMPVSLFPDITFPRIVVLADNGEQPPERMMAEVTRPLEEAASSVPGVTLVRSITSRGSSEISVSLDWGTDVLEKLQYLQGRIDNIRNTLPPTVSVQAEQMHVAVFPILGYSLTSDSLDQIALRDIALYQIRPALVRVPGVARVEVTGGDTREFRVTMHPDKLAAYGLSPSQVGDAIARANILESPGLVQDRSRLYLSIVSGLFRTSDDIGACIIAQKEGRPVRVSDVADVAPAAADKYIRTTAHGREAVLINVMKQPSGSTVSIGRDASKAFEGLKLPRGVHVETFYDQGSFIDRSIRSTQESIIIGIVLAMLVLLVFLRSWRVGIIVAIVVPAVIAATIVCLVAVGFTMNIMTLGGIAAAVALIIDDVIVVIESVFAHVAAWHADADRSRSGLVSLIGGAVHELMPAIIGSTLSTIVIHIPIAFLGGVTGAFFASLSVTMVFALAISFAFSLSLAPLLASRLVRLSDVEHELQRSARQGSMAAWYARVLPAMLRRSWLVVPAAAVILACSWMLFGSIGSDFMPEMDEGTFVLDYNTPPGTSFGETDRILSNVEHILMSTPEVASYSRRTGTQLGFFITEPNSGDFLVRLKDERERPIAQVISDVRRRIAETEPAIRCEFGQLMMDVIGDLTNNPSPIEIKLFGSDPRVVHETARNACELIRGIPGVVDAFDGIVISGPSLIVHVDALQASAAGFDAQKVEEQLGTIVRGSVVSGIHRGEKVIAVRTRFPDAYHTDPDLLGSLLLTNDQGVRIPLRSFARVERTGGQAELDREGLRPLTAVTARIEDRDLGGTVADIKATLAKRLHLPEGVQIEYGGVYQTQQESFRSLLFVALAAILLVFIVLVFEFRSFAVPLSVFVIDVLSLFGVFAALRITGVSFNISSFVGIIMIIGIVAENAIFVLHLVTRFRREGAATDAALLRALQQRARPVVMTTLAAVFALLPLSLGLGAGSQMQQPLAVAVIGGFSVSTILLFFGLPMVYRLFAGNRPVNGKWHVEMHAGT